MGRTVNKQRPVNLDLKTISFPITAIASILHRVSGVITFIALGILLWLLSLSLSSEQGFVQAQAITDTLIVKFILWVILTALAYHVVGGVRHLLMDLGFGEENLAVASRSARIAFAITIVLSLLVGVLVW